MKYILILLTLLFFPLNISAKEYIDISDNISLEKDDMKFINTYKNIFKKEKIIHEKVHIDMR